MSIYHEAELNKVIDEAFRYDFVNLYPLLSLEDNLARLQKLMVPKRDTSRLREAFDQVVDQPAEIPKYTYIQTAGYGQYFITGDTSIHSLGDDKQLAGFVWRTEMAERPHYDLSDSSRHGEMEYTPCLVLNGARIYTGEENRQETELSSLVYLPLNSSQLELDQVLYLD